MTVIDRFSGEWRFLSNFSLPAVVLDDVVYPTVENAYQAAKSFNAEHRSLCRLTTAGNAKRLGRHVALRPDWEQVKTAIMQELLEQKFLASPWRDGLLRTGTAILIEGNDWGDSYWGCVQRPNAIGTPRYVTPAGVKWWGENMLGQLLMQVRAKLADTKARA